MVAREADLQLLIRAGVVAGVELAGLGLLVLPLRSSVPRINLRCSPTLCRSS